ncbi:MAG: tRNA (adenosine(37)-N6)-threonylcarbamoyltransferase complex ATPase subunit type 1 TsaE [Erysipelotrichia bacterium]|nr:tRNA (adenosine(37)-N6)-threonylcarbamoyltransferase complex ATPase subunit type 1 TsaE [Erysipelotrichia bacterium]
MERLEIISCNAEETKRLATCLAPLLEKGSLITLSGQLGAGKTTFTQGLAVGLHIKKHVTSPTFTLLKIYQGDLPLYHIDAYRLEGLNQDLGFEEYIDGDGICVIEWSNFIAELLPQQYLNIEINILDNDCRQLIFKAKGKKYERILDQLCIQ